MLADRAASVYWGMEFQDHARAILLAQTLAGKLQSAPPDLTDDNRGSAVRHEGPARPPDLAISRHGQPRVPPPAGMRDPAQRIRILHALANHELQAAELFAWALLAFPDEPRAFRRGLLKIMGEEQDHCRLYIERLEANGSKFGSLPVSAHFWNKVEDIKTALQFVCTMGLTFENANLDFCVEHIEAARAAGDEETAVALERVHEDEIGHVAFAWHWLGKWSNGDPWATYIANVLPPHGPARARGKTLDVASRVRAGFDQAFIERLEAISPTRPGGAAR